MRTTCSLLLFLVALSVSANDPDYTSDDVLVLETPEAYRETVQTWELLVGRWYGHQRLSIGGRAEVLMINEQDGTYESVGRSFLPDGSALSVKIFGLWGASGGILVRVVSGSEFEGETKLVDRDHWEAREALKIVSLTDTKLVYEELTTGNKVTFIKVGDDFELSEL